MTSYLDRYRNAAVTAPLKRDHALEGAGYIGSYERKLLSNYTCSKISEPEARYLWPRIVDHKWLLSERLSRDVGFHVAAVDYVENFYEPISGERNESKMRPSLKTIKRRANSVIRFYFESKGNNPSF
jgi:hypothetical protein